MLPSFFLFLVYAFIFMLSGCNKKPQQDMVVVQGHTMGTTYSIKLVAASSELPSSDDLLQWSDEVFRNINQSMSTYIPTSELSLINGSDNESWQQVSKDLFYVLSLSHSISVLSDGAFDITVGPLVNLWGFGPEAQQEKVPAQVEIDRVKKSIGFNRLGLNTETASIQKPAGLVIDLSAVAKGFAADTLAKVLMAKGYQNMMIEVGGELVLLGASNRGKAWRIGIETPSYDLLSVSGKKTPVKAVGLSGKAMATSGDYRNYYEQDGIRYSHTISPGTGKPITHNLASVTVIADECAEADALATAFNVLGAELALALAEKNNIAVYLIVRNDSGFDAMYSSAFKPYLIEN